jgi:hypothetical protein
MSARRHAPSNGGGLQLFMCSHDGSKPPTCVPSVLLVVPLASCEVDVCSVDHYADVAIVLVVVEGRLVFALKNLCDLC